MALSVTAPAAILGFFLFIACCYAEKAPYTSFVQDATIFPPEMKYDYIIVGGGTAGCSLATTLSTEAKVLVLERGGLPYTIPAINKSGTMLNLLDTSNSAAQRFVTTDGTYSHRGRCLGGLSAINWGFYSRASDEEVCQNGWNPQLVLESYEWVENKLVFKPKLNEWQSAVRSGLLEAGVAPDRGFTYEHLNGTKTGGTTFDENGRRHGAADLLEYAVPDNISVYLHATVQRILFETTTPGERPKANGVLFKDSLGHSHVAYLNNRSTSEIILSAGAIGSPQLLMLSGIGPMKELEAQNIDVILDQPEVGQGMCDNPANVIFIPSPSPTRMSLVEIVGISDFGSIIEGTSGLLQLNSALMKMTQDLVDSDNQNAQPINQIFINATVAGFGLNSNPDTQNGLIWQKVTVPYSTGYLKLETRDPNDNPRVTFNYYQDPRDLQKCVKGMEIVKGVVDSKSFSRYRTLVASFDTIKNTNRLLPMNLRSKNVLPSSMEQFCNDTVISSWHYHGGCQVGKVVDHDYKVFGVESLRVIDGSTFSNSPGTNPQATVMMLGRYMGQRILGRESTH